MISARRFALSEPDLFKASQDFVQAFSAVPDPALFVSKKARTLKARIAWTLFSSAIFQGISFTDLKNVLVELFKEFPEEKLWTLPVPKDQEIKSVVERVLQGKDWSLKDHLPGIFWSVGSFVRHHEDLVQWATQRSAAEIWRDLGEIYFMGKSKPRPKAATAIYRLKLPAPLGLGVDIKGVLPPIPLTMGARRYLSILGAGKYVKFSELSAEEKQSSFTDLLSELSVDNPYQAAHGLQFFLESGRKDFSCHEFFKQCRHCPLYKHCKYASLK